MYKITKNIYGGFVLTTAEDKLNIPVELTNELVPVINNIRGVVPIIGNALSVKVRKFKKFKIPLTDEDISEIEEFLEIIEVISPTIRDKIGISQRTLTNIIGLKNKKEDEKKKKNKLFKLFRG